jgi:D-threo-aldose 1-dehydrogenase
MARAADRKTFATPLGRELGFSRLGFGGVAVGSMFQAVDDVEAEATLAAAWEAGLRYFDTAPLYGFGLSETRIGRALAARPRDAFVLSTKVGRLLEPKGAARRFRYDYTRDAVRRSFDESLARLGLSRVDILYVHDLELPTHASTEVLEAHWADLTRGGGWRALAELRAAGVVAAIGLGVNDAAACERVLAELDPDLFLLAGRYTLLEQTPLRGLLPACQRRGVGVVIGGPFNSGVLVRPGGQFNYAPAPADVLARVERLRATCARFGVPSPAAALQFAAAHPVVVSVIPGAQTPTEVAANVAWFDAEIPPALWTALKDEDLIDAAAPVPAAETAPC